MTQQLPISSIIMKRLFDHQSGEFVSNPGVFINGGAVIDAEMFKNECKTHGLRPTVHPHAAIITQAHRDQESVGGPSRIASTGKGVGAAIASKVMRENPGIGSLVFELESGGYCSVKTLNDNITKNLVVFVETSQGFSLGINSGFYPHCTSRECSVGQSMADARLPARSLRKVAACYRTFPIRVGNTNVGYSGDCYNDQHETSWEEMGFEPELTSVTKRVRRVFTWSWEQFYQSLIVNDPDLVFINFLQYLHKEERINFLESVRSKYLETLGRPLETLLVGYGPNNSDVKLYERSLVWYENDLGEEICEAP
jgi:adenylosuccinate synthase